MVIDWSVIIAIATSILAATSAILQSYKDKNNKIETLRKEKASAEKQAELEAELKRNYKSMRDSAEVIVDLQRENKKELQEKTGKIIQLQEELNDKNLFIISQQKENLNYVTGGDKLLQLFPDMYTDEYNKFYVKIVLSNQTKYPQQDIEVVIVDDFKHQIFKDSLRNNPLFPMAQHVLNEEITKLRIDKIEPYNGRIIYQTNIPNQLKKGWFGIQVSSRNGKFSKTIYYSKPEDKGAPDGYWQLDNIDEFYPKTNK